MVLAVFVIEAADAPAAKDKPKVESKETAAKDLFNGKDLAGWKKTEFGGEGEVEIKDGQIIAHLGAQMTGVQYTNSLPTNNYAITFEAMKIEGDDFFGALTFPVGASHLSLILGGWGGSVVGLSSLDGMDASENETTKYITFKKNQWYKIRVEVKSELVKVWIDGDEIVNAPLKDRKVSLRPGPIELQAPFGLSTYQTTAAWRNIRIAPLPAKP